MNTLLMVLCITLGFVGIFSTLFSIFTNKRNREKVKASKKVIQHKIRAIESLQNENAFLRYTVDKHKDWMDDLLN